MYAPRVVVNFVSIHTRVMQVSGHANEHKENVKHEENELVPQ